MSGSNKTEIEYKFSIRCAETFDFLTALFRVKDYPIKDKSHPLFTDIFYDTPDLLLFSLGIYLRKRLEEGRSDAVWTLKQAGGGFDEEVCRRREIIQVLPQASAVKDISNPAFEKMLTGILGDLELVPILTLEQDRIFKTVYKKGTSEDTDNTSENRLADLSVDSVSLKFSEQKHTFTELEIELAKGTENELQEFIDTLKDMPELQNKIESSRLSKLERGLILYFSRDKIEGNVIPDFEKKSYFTDLDGNEISENGEEKRTFEYDSTDFGFLLPQEKAALMQLCGKIYTADPTDYFGDTGFLKKNEKNGDLFSKNASILLSLDSGMSSNFAAQAFDLPEYEINEILEKFKQSRTDMFPFAFEIGENERYYYQKPIDDGKTWTAEELVKYYGLDAAQSELKAEIASELFDSVQAANNLSEKDRMILKAAARFSGIGKGTSLERNVNIGADIILTHPIENLTLNEIKTLALIFILRKIKNPSPDRIRKAILKAGFYVPLSYQRKALVAAALLEKEVFSEMTFGFDIETEHENSDSAIDSKGGIKIDFENVSKPDLRIESTDMMAVAAEKILLGRLYEVEEAEPGVLAERDIKDVHDMRVALRKMRSANLIFKDFLDHDRLAEMEAGIRKTLSGLGELRDLDVILEKTDGWLKKEKVNQEKMTVFYDFVSSDRKKAHAEVADYLTSKEYTDFIADLKKTFGDKTYLGIPNINRKGDVAPVRINDVLPAILYEKAADITAYHEWMDGPYIYVDKLHRLRIAAKNFRYTLDFFKDCLGEAAGQLIKEFKELQEILGDFHDAVVAIEVIGDYIERIKEESEKEENEKEESRKSNGKARADEIENTLETLDLYKNDREEEMEKLLAAFHTKWEKMDRRFFNERIAKIIAEADF
ncbi:MAG: CHAD domain-containing protein [Methanosarcinales archaeon]|jgi:CHAD domain-containing protein|nr:CHAD domain-containing protein [Methanosarcinales archaeon]